MCADVQWACGAQAVLVRLSAKLMRAALQYTDERAKIEGELLSAMDVVKCATWEVSACCFG